MYYFEHCLRDAGASDPGTIAVVRAPGEAWLYDDLRAELEDACPRAVVRMVPPGEPIAPVDLLVVVLDRPWRFPLDDVAYDQLDRVAEASAQARAASFVMIFRAGRRDAEIVPGRALARRLRRRRRERRLLTWLPAARQRPRWLRPRFPLA